MSERCPTRVSCWCRCRQAGSLRPTGSIDHAGNKSPGGAIRPAFFSSTPLRSILASSAVPAYFTRGERPSPPARNLEAIPWAGDRKPQVPAYSGPPSPLARP
jgi:hypothetical protein